MKQEDINPKNEPIFCFTSDVDWASDIVWRKMHQLYESYKIPPTYFISHNSEFLRELKTEAKSAFGIHPNFMPGSSQGKSVAEIVDFVFSLVPGTQYSRCHVYFDSNEISYLLRKRGILFDSNTCTRLASDIKPFILNSGIMRFPVFFEDGNYSELKRDWAFETLLPTLETPGLKIFDLHPVNVIFNVPDREHYNVLRQAFPAGRWSEMSAKDITNYAFKGEGPLTLTREIFKYVTSKKKKVLSFTELCRRYREF